MTAPRHIVAAAIKQGKVICSVPRPGRHHDVIRQMAAAGFPIPVDGAQGFLTDDGLFVDRRHALAIAQTAKQVTVKNGNAKELFSEDLW